jgi:hypothetical protein
MEPQTMNHDRPLSAVCVVTDLHFQFTKPLERLLPSAERFGLTQALISTMAAFHKSAAMQRIRRFVVLAGAVIVSLTKQRTRQ